MANNFASSLRFKGPSFPGEIVLQQNELLVPQVETFRSFDSFQFLIELFLFRFSRTGIYQSISVTVGLMVH